MICDQWRCEAVSTVTSIVKRLRQWSAKSSTLVQIQLDPSRVCTVLIFSQRLMELWPSWLRHRAHNSRTIGSNPISSTKITFITLWTDNWFWRRVIGLMCIMSVRGFVQRPRSFLHDAMIDVATSSISSPQCFECDYCEGYYMFGISSGIPSLLACDTQVAP